MVTNRFLLLGSRWHYDLANFHSGCHFEILLRRSALLYVPRTRANVAARHYSSPATADSELQSALVVLARHQHVVPVDPGTFFTNQRNQLTNKCAYYSILSTFRLLKSVISLFVCHRCRRRRKCLFQRLRTSDRCHRLRCCRYCRHRYYYSCCCWYLRRYCYYYRRRCRCWRTRRRKAQ